MKKTFKILVISFICLSICFASISFSFAALGEAFDQNNIAPGDGDTSPVFESQFNKIWTTVVYVARIAAFVGIFILGITYIFSNADRKAELKKSLIPTLIGIVIFFGATYVIQFIIKLFGEI